jgi:hypothetical protein
MDPGTGDAFQLREELVGDTEIGGLIDRDRYVERMREIVDASEDERRAAESKLLVRISEQAARKLKLGEREQRRRQRRRRRH